MLTGVLGWPENFAAAAQGEVRDVAGASCRHTALYRRIGLLSISYAGEEILHMGDSSIFDAAFCQNGILVSCAFPIDRHPSAINFERCIRTAKFKTAVVDRRDHCAFVAHFKAWISQSRLDRVRTLPGREDILIAHSLCFLRLGDLHRPMDDIDPVGEQVGHGTAAEVPEPAPISEFFFVEGLIGRRTEPAFPIEQVQIDGYTRGAVLIILIPIRAHARDTANVAALKQVDSALEMNPAPLLHTALEDASRATHGAS